MTVTDPPRTSEEPAQPQSADGAWSPQTGRSDAARRYAAARLGIRLARRELRRHPWRALLVVLMVFLPTLAMTAGVTALRTSEWSPTDEQIAQFGQADASASPLSENTTVEPSAQEIAQLRAGLPKGARLVVENRSSERARLGDERAYVSLSDLAIDDPINRGRFGPVEGRLPRSGDEAVLSEDVARRLDASVGDTFTADRLGRRMTVVGVVTISAGNNQQTIFTKGPLPPNSLPVEPPSAVLVDMPGSSPENPSDSIANATQPEGWNIFVLSEQGMGSGTDHSEARFWSYVAGGIGLIVLATIITAAFAVGARKQIRSIGLLSATGASASTIKWFLVAQGVVAGLVGSVVAVAAGSVVMWLLPDPVLSAVAGRPVDGPTTHLLDLIPILIIGTVVAAGAAWLPARSASQVPTLQALAGRRPLPQVPRRLPALGAVSMAGGCGLLAIAVAGAGPSRSSSLWALVAVGGGLAVLLGAIAIAPWIIAALEPSGARLPGSWRLAARSLARSRVRSSAVVGAICAIAAAVIAGGTLAQSLNLSAERVHREVADDQIAIISYDHDTTGIMSSQSDIPAEAPTQLLDQIEGAVPGGRAHRVQDLLYRDAPEPNRKVNFRFIDGEEAAGPVDDHSGSGSTFEPQSAGVATPELLDLLAVPTPLRQRITEGGLVSVIEPPDKVRSVALLDPSTTEPLVSKGSMALSGWFDSPSAAGWLPTLLMSETTAAGLGLESAPGPATVVDFPMPLTSRQREKIDLLASDFQWDADEEARIEKKELVRQADVALPRTPERITPATVRAGLLGLSLVLALAVVAVGLALAAKDSEDERQVLTAVGAPPATLRQVAALRAVLLVAIAAAIAVPTGLLPAAAIMTAANDPHRPLRVDFWAVLFVLVAAPVLVGVATWVGGRVRDAVRPKRPATFAFGE